MYYKNYIKGKSSSDKSIKKQPEFIEKAIDFVSPVMDDLNSKMDKRLTYTVFDTFMGILNFRDKINGLVLSELGAYVNGPKHAPAGTKRISNLLRNKSWSHEDIGQIYRKK
jgi:hypothetical protein